MGKTYRYQPLKHDEDRRSSRKEKRERTNDRRIGKMKSFDDPFTDNIDYDDYDDNYIDR